jgi:solute carrier family 10 (sodium/bile acid cotransporter), member 7
VVLTTQAGGNTSGALFNAVLSNLAGVVLTPLWILLMVGGSGEMRPLGPVLRELSLLIVLPLLVGQVLRRWGAAMVETRRTALGNLNQSIILFIVYVAFANSVAAGFWAGQSVWGVWHAAALVGILFFLATVFVRLLASWFRLDRSDRIAAYFCGTQKTLAAGVPLAQVIFGAHPALGMILLPIMLYHGLQLMLGGARAARVAGDLAAEQRS